jgi:arylsulfatase A-like enzyme
MARAGTRFSACITPNLVCQPSRARSSPACCRIRTAYPTTHRPRSESRRSGFRGRVRKAGYRTGYIGKAHFATSHTFKPTGTPECRNSDQDPDWTGPYMGFEHVELVVEGHNHWPPMKPPRGQHYERWFHKGGRGEALQRLYETQLEPRSSAMQTFHSALPVAFPQLDLDRRQNH